MLLLILRPERRSVVLDPESSRSARRIWYAAARPTVAISVDPRNPERASAPRRVDACKYSM